ncbi:hypothetical protein C9J48_01685 [Photobacterium profundum]|uniref:Uncharacterized protein n=1 Tax=Photobacterium profundum 3TCK TaxID=314280 RepID=Q1Z5F5_9GAMM|nr:hypothetical protein [Photobacterium profundum]EAS43611.1 hypothetical protein P3TCK_17567 [Photobacterium profundum 3TCK]PSV64195.1 hypothetical protein C9J48_01685 [Photobacterium profundum]
MNNVNLQAIPPNHLSIICHFCGKPLNYIYLRGATVAFCPNSEEEDIDKMIDSIKPEELAERVNVYCK